MQQKSQGLKGEIRSYRAVFNIIWVINLSKKMLSGLSHSQLQCLMRVSERKRWSLFMYYEVIVMNDLMYIYVHQMIHIICEHEAIRVHVYRKQ